MFNGDFRGDILPPGHLHDLNLFGGVMIASGNYLSIVRHTQPNGPHFLLPSQESTTSTLTTLSLRSRQAPQDPAEPEPRPRARHMNAPRIAGR